MEDKVIRILGPLSIKMGDAEATPSAPKERRVLSLLLANYSKAVKISTIIDELWETSPPKTAQTIVQTYILNIRKGISQRFGIPRQQVDEKLLRTGNLGYTFDTQSCFLDVHEYRKLESEGRLAVQVGDNARAVYLLRRAEELWRGPALMDVEHGLPLRAEVAKLEQSQLVTRELRINVELMLGRHHEVLSELSSLVLLNPFNEKLHGFFMVALHRSGRRAQALDVFRRLRRCLADELGLTPSKELVSIHQKMLS